MKIGITSTIPVEVVYAAGHQPCDLNNLFINDADPGHFIHRAEEAGFPRTSCAWIKGIYGVMLEQKIERIIIVSGGDCSNSIALGEILHDDGKEVIPFSYPLTPDPRKMTQAINDLADRLQARQAQTCKIKTKLDEIRLRLGELDRLTWQTGQVSGDENLLFLVSASDFNGDPQFFAKNLATFLALAAERQPVSPKIRLGLAGVPPILSNLFITLEQLGAAVIFNEVPRQFAMLQGPETNLAEQYSLYTYPYSVAGRLQDIMRACRERRLDGIIHYTQSFCFRQIEDILFKRQLPVPCLTLEADQPGAIDGRTLTRLETFIEMLKG
ncbi:MAG: 2-hydroxyacyl-CoA dehydratase [Deltaproteobacteria bacterium]|nr:2-hydroxyacyl-CoA dehydratase [Deltaproteobacteria bacterium]